MKGFTLVEMLIAAAIVALLATVALPLAEVTVQRNREADLRRSLRDLRGAIDAYKRAADDGLIEKKADASGYPEKLALLVEGVPEKGKPDGAKVYFLRRIPKDPVSGAEWGLRSYASPADDPRDGKDVYDVYSRSDEPGLNKVPYKEW